MSETKYYVRIPGMNGYAVVTLKAGLLYCPQRSGTDETALPTRAGLAKLIKNTAVVFKSDMPRDLRQVLFCDTPALIKEDPNA